MGESEKDVGKNTGENTHFNEELSQTVTYFYDDKVYLTQRKLPGQRKRKAKRLCRLSPRPTDDKKSKSSATIDRRRLKRMK